LELECPLKVHFIWRVGMIVCQLELNIQRQQVELDTRCAICNRGFEDGGHLFLGCSDAKKVSRAFSLDTARCALLDCSSGLNLLEEIFTIQYEEKMKCIAFLWCWWTERNKANHGERNS
jgi:hypothetical protein